MSLYIATSAVCVTYILTPITSKFEGFYATFDEGCRAIRGTIGTSICRIMFNISIRGLKGRPGGAESVG